MDITQHVCLFKKLILHSWKVVEECKSLDRSTFWVQNWLQANWEMMMEGLLNQDGRQPMIVLDYYGEGSEDLHHGLIEGQHGYDRVSLPNISPTHSVVCKKPDDRKWICLFTSKEVSADLYVLDRLATMKAGRAVEEPPFDVVVMKNFDDYAVVDISDVRFVLTPINQNIKK